MGTAELFVGGLILTTIAGNAALKRLIPDPPKTARGVLREMVHTREIIRETLPTSSNGRTVMCPFCNKIIQ